MQRRFRVAVELTVRVDVGAGFDEAGDDTRPVREVARPIGRRVQEGAVTIPVSERCRCKPGMGIEQLGEPHEVATLHDDRRLHHAGIIGSDECA